MGVVPKLVMLVNVAYSAVQKNARKYCLPLVGNPNTQKQFKYYTELGRKKIIGFLSPRPIAWSRDIFGAKYEIERGFRQSEKQF